MAGLTSIRADVLRCTRGLGIDCLLLLAAGASAMEQHEKKTCLNNQREKVYPHPCCVHAGLSLPSSNAFSFPIQFT